MAANDLLDMVSTANYNPDAVQARITREQWKRFEQFYKPIENELFQKASESPEPFAARAAADAERAYQAARGSAVRSMSRYGQQLDPTERSRLERRFGLRSALASTSAKNSVRRSISDENLQTLGDAIGIGKGIASSSAQTVGEAAQLARARENQYQQARAAHQQDVINSTMMGAGLGYAIGGTMAAAGAGAGIGLLAALI